MQILDVLCSAININSSPSIHLTFCCTFRFDQDVQISENPSEEYDRLCLKRCKAAMVLGEKHQDIHLLAFAYSTAAEFADDRHR